MQQSTEVDRRTGLYLLVHSETYGVTDQAVKIQKEALYGIFHNWPFCFDWFGIDRHRSSTFYKYFKWLRVTDEGSISDIRI